MGAVVLSINTQHLAVDSFITALNAPNLHVRDTRAALRSAQSIKCCKQARIAVTYCQILI